MIFPRTITISCVHTSFWCPFKQWAQLTLIIGLLLWVLITTSSMSLQTNMSMHQVQNLYPEGFQWESVALSGHYTAQYTSCNCFQIRKNQYLSSLVIQRYSWVELVNTSCLIHLIGPLKIHYFQIVVALPIADISFHPCVTRMVVCTINYIKDWVLCSSRVSNPDILVL